MGGEPDRSQTLQKKFCSGWGSYPGAVPSAALRFRQRSKPTSLDGCPMFAPAYMGRKGWGAAPSNAPATRANRMWPRERILVHGVKAFENSAFGPCTLGRTWGTRPGPKTVVGRLDPPQLRLAALRTGEHRPDDSYSGTEPSNRGTPVVER
jgi:hypothetical protein